ncbi:PAS fold-containing protein [Natronoarchaeum philippinense]|uniref:histidine kinase n=1 Tax=Natronoarchaeum philippinense TaxID=558529 RepID=A0A285NY85_NATPI|nr:histidine kinase N-terminal 7TM domain-containing protein [Natronoarchaeum philippinense]SNZ12846.1 PAS fold-containing protein [Natronoarchaeum philippinense]
MSSLSLGVSWLAVLTLCAGGANLALLWVVRQYRDRPGGTWFVALVGAMAAVCFSYGVGLTVFEPVALRYGLEVLFWLTGGWAAFSWFAFSLAYTGRGRLLRSGPIVGIAAIVVVLTVLLSTNQYHQLAWTEFRVVPAYGAATVRYDRGIALTAGFALIAVLIASSLVVLLETVVSYGRLFRLQTVALALTPVLPTVALLTYVFEIGSMPRVNLLPLTLVPHMLLDTYALYGGDMFKFDPATRRIGERTAIDDVDTPVVTVDNDARIITFNAAAGPLLDADDRSIVGDPLDEHLSATVDPARSEQDIELLEGGRRRHYRTTASPFYDADETRLGYTVAFQDITDIVQRERHFEVLNRVLRHNLRNDLTVVTGHASRVESQLDDPELSESVSIVVDESQQLLELADRARELDRSVREQTEPSAVELRSVIDQQVGEIDAAASADIAVNVAPSLTVRTDPTLLGLVVGNLLQNAVEHNDADDPVVTVRTDGPARDGQAIRLEIADNGPGIPSNEVAVLEDGSETALEHGSGLGLWVVQTGVTALGGDLSFSTGEEGTTVAVVIPGLVDDAGDEAAHHS